MKRADVIAALGSGRAWDILVIGGGATGLGIALDAAARGYATALVEAADFAHGTSSRSTKLIHGGVRYLRSGQLGLVRRGLLERDVLRQNAAGLVRDLGFIIPAYAWSDRLFYGTGLTLYDLLAGSHGLGRTRWLNAAETRQQLPGINPHGLRGGVLYHDCQFDDARLAWVLARTAIANGAVLANHTRVTALIKSSGRVTGAVVRDERAGGEIELRARVVINATGVGVDRIRRLDEPSIAALIAPSQGAHVVLPAEFLPGERALMIPKTSDGRVLFAIPWLGRVLLGTTDTALERVEAEPQPFPAEIAFLLNHAAEYLARPPSSADVLSVFAGARPLVTAAGAKSTAALSRDHLTTISNTGLVTITGGKWTTYRWMAEDAVNRAASVAGLPSRPCPTTNLQLERAAVDAKAADEPSLHPRLTIAATDVRRAVREEMACTLDDVLARRTRSLILDARAAIEVAPTVSRLMAAELGWSAAEEQGALERFRALAAGYLIR